jgi:hypothetical protein
MVTALKLDVKLPYRAGLKQNICISIILLVVSGVRRVDGPGGLPQRAAEACGAAWVLLLYGMSCLSTSRTNFIIIPWAVFI